MNQALKTATAACLLAAALTLSHALMRAAANHPQFSTDWAVRIAGALALYFVIFFAYSFLLRSFALATLYPTYTGLSIVGTFVVGIGYFHESANPQKWLGVAAIVLGVVLLAKE